MQSHLRRSISLLHYFLQLAIASFRTTPWITGGMILAIAFGISCSMTTLTVLHVLSADPLPQKSRVLFQVSLSDSQDGEDSSHALMSYADAANVLRGAGQAHMAAFASGLATVVTSASDVSPAQVLVRYTTAGFFSLFDVPFLLGNAWDKTTDELGAGVAVVTSQRAIEWFGDSNAIGRTFTMGGQNFKVIGVLSDWRPAPRFFDLSSGVYLPADDVYIPLEFFKNLNSEAFASFACNPAVPVLPEGNDKLPQSACDWVSIWLELRSTESVVRFEDYLAALSKTVRPTTLQGEAGSFQLADLHDVIARAKVVPGDIRLYTLLAFGFLGLCLTNVTGLLLTKFMRRAQEVGIRRALGASRKHILVQFFTESVLVGLCGGGLGLVFTYIALFFVRRLPVFFADLAHIDAQMLAVIFLLSLLTGLIAGTIPGWLASRVEPGLQVKAG